MHDIVVKFSTNLTRLVAQYEEWMISLVTVRYGCYLLLQVWYVYTHHTIHHYTRLRKSTWVGVSIYTPPWTSLDIHHPQGHQTTWWVAPRSRHSVTSHTTLWDRTKQHNLHITMGMSVAATGSQWTHTVRPKAVDSWHRNTIPGFTESKSSTKFSWRT